MGKYTVDYKGRTLEFDCLYEIEDFVCEVANLDFWEDREKVTSIAQRLDAKKEKQ